MNSATDTRTPLPSDSALAEAAAWIARLHGPERTEAVESGWRDWFRAHPDHATAWEVLSDEWNTNHAIPIALVNPPVHLRGRASRKPLRLALAATVAIAVVTLLIGSAIVFFWQGWVTTAVGEQRTLNLGDGTRIELNTATRLAVKYDAKTRVVDLQSGEAYFSVAHESRPFVVKVGNRKVIALGTSFTVRRDPSADDSTTVTLIEGRVAVTPAAAPNVLPQQKIPEVTIMSAGERLQLRRHAPISVDTPSIDRVTGWMRGQLIFDHTPLAEAVAELNRYGTMRLSVASPEAGHILVSGTFRLSGSASFAEAAAQTYNLKLIRRDDGIVLEPDDSQPQTPRRPEG